MVKKSLKKRKKRYMLQTVLQVTVAARIAKRGCPKSSSHTTDGSYNVLVGCSIREVLVAGLGAILVIASLLGQVASLIRPKGLLDQANLTLHHIVVT